MGEWGGGGVGGEGVEEVEVGADEDGGGGLIGAV